jgi:23S rRNA (guanosine2251-2'-O)-methyltransferase
LARLIYGKRTVLEVLEAGTPKLQKVILAKGLDKKDSSKVMDLAKAAGTPVEWQDRSWHEQHCQGGNHQGLAAMAPDFTYANLTDVLKRAPASCLLVILDQVEDPQNLGAIIRSCDAVGALAVVIPKDHAVQVTPSVEKVAAGACAHLPVASVVNISQSLEEIKKAGFWCYGLAQEAKDLFDDEAFKGKVCLVLGSEGKGLRPLVERNCDKVLRLTVRGKVSSYNVSVAAGIALYQAARSVL